MLSSLSGSRRPRRVARWARGKAAGVNRLSVGVQSFDDNLLKAMDRYEKYGSGASIASRLREIGGLFDTLNADMIFNFARQTPKSLNADIDRLLETGVDHVLGDVDADQAFHKG